MKIKSSLSKAILIISLAVLVALLGIRPGLAQSPANQPPPPATQPEIIPGEIVVKFQPNVGSLGAQNSLRAEGLQPLEVSPDNGIVRVQVKPGQEAQTIAELLARGDVAYATYNYEIKALRDPNDPGFSNQWALNQPMDHDIDAPEAWDLYTGGSNITIAVIDSGVDLSHPDLAAKITTGSQAGYNFVSNPPGSLPPDDDYGHGTHVAGIAAAAGNNGIGIAGVSWGAMIMPLKVLDASGNGGTYNLSLAIRYAADHGAKIINMSLGGACGTGWPDVTDAVNYALGKGVLLVAAAGNSFSTPVLCPAAISGVMAVGATNSSDLRPAYSTYGAALDVAAPGDSIYSTYLGGGYTTMSGTSMATPHVAGLAALLWSYAPTLNNSQVKTIIESTTDDLGTPGWDQYYGYGRINARRALERLALQITPNPPLLLVGDNVPTASSYVRVITASPVAITWSAAISPTVPWLSLNPPASGMVSASSTDQFMVLNATIPSPGNHQVYTANLVLTGATASGTFSPIIIPIQVEYVPNVHTDYFPFMFKN